MVHPAHRDEIQAEGLARAARETEAQSGEATCPRAHGELVTEQRAGFERLTCG